MVDNLLAYRDDNHLSTSYATWLAPLLAAAGQHQRRPAGGGGAGAG